MKESTQYKIEFILTIILVVGVLIFKFIPEFKASLGSSDSFLNPNTYDGIIEIKINDKPNFALVTEKEHIRAILFFDKASLCLYNQNIENMTIEDGVSTIVELLIEKDYLKSSYTMTFVKYSENSYQKVITAFKNKLQDMKVVVSYAELQLTLEEKAKSLNIDINNQENIIRDLELYSKEIIRHNKNNISEYEEPTIGSELTEEVAKELANNVYKKIENYVAKNNIINQQTTAATLPITLIPANQEGNIFPDAASWYYIQDSKVHAYISITSNNRTFSYCYQGSIDAYKKGQC